MTALHGQCSLQGHGSEEEACHPCFESARTHPSRPHPPTPTALESRTARSGASVTGVNNNDYQIKRGTDLNRKVGTEAGPHYGHMQEHMLELLSRLLDELGVHDVVWGGNQPR